MKKCVQDGGEAAPFLPEPYRRGSYLIYDYDGKKDDDKEDHFRRGDDGKLDPKLRASGSRQLDAPRLATRLGEISTAVPAIRRLHVFDLRQESHLFYLVPPCTNVYTEGRAVSWYADRDWSNIGQSREWILADEEGARIRSYTVKTNQVFTICEEANGNVRPTSVTDITVKGGATEMMVVSTIGSQFWFPTTYHRAPTTDHCPPLDSAVNYLLDLVDGGTIDPAQDWVHFHCHGGDGRTTTFLAIYDMKVYHRSCTRFPSLEQFAQRQCALFSYDLDPGKCDPKDWTCDLKRQRWAKLQTIHDRIERGS